MPLFLEPVLKTINSLEAPSVSKNKNKQREYNLPMNQILPCTPEQTYKGNPALPLLPELSHLSLQPCPEAPA